MIIKKNQWNFIWFGTLVLGVYTVYTQKLKLINNVPCFFRRLKS